MADNKKMVITKLASHVEELQSVVSKMSSLYEQNDWLNDEVSLGSVVPMSLDEWASELSNTVEKLKDQAKSL